MTVKERTRLQEVDVQALDAARLEPLIGPERTARYEAMAEATESLLEGRTVLNVNSTAAGGGVAEMLQTLLAYARGAGRRRALARDRGRPRRSSRSPSGSTTASTAPPATAARSARPSARHYERTLRSNADELLALVRPDDVVLLHDPQPAGLAAAAEARRRAASSGAATSASTRRTSGPSAPGSSCARTSSDVGRVRVLARRLRAALGRPRRGCRDPAVDRPVLGQERADLAAANVRRSSATSA